MPAPDHRIGMLLDGLYRLDRLLGQGGVGAVYCAFHLGLQRSVAVKLLHPQFAQLDELLQRFLREAKVLSSLGHPSFVAVYDFGHAEDGTAYLVMELVEGETLRARLRRGAMPIGEVLAVFQPLCEAMDKAHQKGILHRDLKPDNLMLQPGGRLKILDFGLAKILSQRSTLTGEKAVPGTLNYIAPERAIGRRDEDARSDIFALGAILFELLAARLAFPGEAPAPTLQRVLRAPVPTLGLPDRALSERLDEVIATACAKDPRDRYASALALLEALQAAAHPGAPPPSVALAAIDPQETEVKAGLLIALLHSVQAQYGEGGTQQLVRQLGEERLVRYRALLPSEQTTLRRLHRVLAALGALFDDGSGEAHRRAGRHCAQQLLLGIYRGFLVPGTRATLARRAQILLEALLPGAQLRLMTMPGERFCLELQTEPAPEPALGSLCAGWLARFLELCGGMPILLKEEVRYRDGQPVLAITFAFSA